MAKYRKKPMIVEAEQWTGKNTSLVRCFCPVAGKIMDGRRIAYLLIRTLEGNRPVRKNDWIIFEDGNFSPCKPDIFEQTYEPVE